MRPAYIALLLLISIVLTSEAKTRPPCQSNLSLESVTDLGHDVLEYAVKFQFKADIDSKNIIFTTELTDGISLENGFMTWRGELKKGFLFERLLTLRAPKTNQGKMNMIVEMTISEHAKSTHILSLQLEPQPSKEKALAPVTESIPPEESARTKRIIRRY